MIGPAGRLARAIVGIGFISLALFWRDFEWVDAALGLIVMPAVVLAAALLRSRFASRPLHATGPVGHFANLTILLPLFLLPATAGGAFLFFGTSMLLAAVRRSGACEITAFSNAVLRRDDQIGCPLFAPVDAVERARQA